MSPGPILVGVGIDGEVGGKPSCQPKKEVVSVAGELEYECQVVLRWGGSWRGNNWKRAPGRWVVNFRETLEDADRPDFIRDSVPREEGSPPQSGKQNSVFTYLCLVFTEDKYRALSCHLGS